MNITSAQYFSDGNENLGIVLVVDNKGVEEKLSVPINPDNRHYQAILEWVAEGNTIEEAD